MNVRFISEGPFTNVLSDITPSLPPSTIGFQRLKCAYVYVGFRTLVKGPRSFHTWGLSNFVQKCCQEVLVQLAMRFLWAFFNDGGERKAAVKEFTLVTYRFFFQSLATRFGETYAESKRREFLTAKVDTLSNEFGLANGFSEQQFPEQRKCVLFLSVLY